MKMKSLLSFFDRTWRKRKAPAVRNLRTARPWAELLESRELLAGTPPAILSAIPINGSTTANGTPLIQVQYTESMVDSSPTAPGSATNPSSYVLISASGISVPITAVTCLDPVVPLGSEPLNSIFQISYSSGNPGNQLIVDTYTLFVRGDRVVDSTNFLPVANSAKVVVSNSGDDTIAVADVPGDGTLGAQSIYPLTNGFFGGNAVNVVTGDLNGDGIKDLVVVDLESPQIEVYAGQPASAGGGYALTPTFTANLPGGGGTGLFGYATIADFNNDGKLDIAVAGETGFGGTGRLTVFTNTGAAAGAFGFTSVNYATDASPRGIATADFNGDGKLDIAVSSNALGSDLDADGNGDYRVDFFPGNGDGSLGTMVPIKVGDNIGVPTSEVRGPAGIAAADFNGDGKPDLVVTGFGNFSLGSTAILTNNGGPGFNFTQTMITYSGTGSASSPGFANTTITTATPHGLINGQTVVITGASAPLTGLNNNTYTVTVLTPTTFQINAFVAAGVSNVTWTVADSAVSVSVGNVDAGGTPDIIVNTQTSFGASPDELQIYLNTGATGATPSFTTMPIFAAGNGQAGQIAVGDLANNGRTDVVLTHLAGNAASVYLDGVMGGAINDVSYGPAGIAITSISSAITGGQEVTITGADSALNINGTWTVNPLAGGIASVVGDGLTDIVITTSGPNQLVTGTQVTLSGINGFFAANGTFTITVTGPNTFTLNGTAGAIVNDLSEPLATWTSKDTFVLKSIGIVSADTPGATDVTITSAAPTGLLDGDQVMIRGLSGNLASALNGNTYTVTVTGPNTFTLNGTSSIAAANDITNGNWVFLAHGFTSADTPGGVDVTITVPNLAGLATGDKVLISGLTGPLASALNGNVYTITVSGLNTFTLDNTATVAAGTDGSGTWTEVYTGGASWVLTGTNITAVGTLAGPVTITTTSTAGLLTGDTVLISGLPGFAAINNKSFIITVTSSTTFTLNTTQVGSATGGTWTVVPTFFAPANNNYPVPSGPYGVTLADTNQDGNLDVIVADRGVSFPGDFSVLLGGGDGTLRIPTTTAAGNNPGQVVTADINGDGLPDALVVVGGNEIDIYAGLPGGGFSTSPVALTLSGFHQISSIAVGRVVNQGQGSPAKPTNLPDIAFIDSNNDILQVWENRIPTVGGTISAPFFSLNNSINTGFGPTQVALGDFNNDGKLDAIVTAGNRGTDYFQGGGDGSFQPAVVYDNPGSFNFDMVGVVVGDFNKDGNMDFAAVEDAGFGSPAVVHLHFGDGKGGFGTVGGTGLTFTTLVDQPNAIVSGDFNGDGYLDVAVISGDNNANTGGISVQLNQFGGGLGTSVLTPTIQRVGLQSGVAADINDDGIPDLIVTVSSFNQATNAYVLIGKNDGSFNSPIPYTVGNVNAFGGITPSFVAVTPSPLTPITTFTAGGDLLRTNLITNGSFAARDLAGSIGSLSGWQTYDLPDVPGSAGSWNVQSGTISPLSSTPVPPPTGGFRALLDQSIPDPFRPFQGNPNNGTHAQRAQNFGGSHALYQDITIPDLSTGLSMATLSLNLYVDNSDNGGNYSSAISNPSLDWRTAANNQQVRVDLIDPDVIPSGNSILGGTSIVPAGNPESFDGVLRTEFITSPTSGSTFSINISDSDLLAFAGRTIRLRIAVANNDGLMLVGVGAVSLTVQYHKHSNPTLSNLQVRNTEFVDPSTNLPHTNDPTIMGTIGDTFSLASIAYIAFDPTNSGFQAANTLKLTQWDVLGNFTFTLPNPLPGVNTIAVRVVDKAGDHADAIFQFFMQTPSVVEWQAVGPQNIDTNSQSNVDYAKVSGRITATLADISDPSGNTIFLGTPNGGIWKSTDGGGNYHAVTPFLTDSNGNALPAPIASITQGQVAGVVNQIKGDGHHDVVVTTSFHANLATGDRVTISNLGIFTAANGTYTITMVPGSSGTQFTLNGTAGLTGTDNLAQGKWVDTNKTVLFAATGIADQQLDSRTGVGILESINDGETWQVVGNSLAVLGGARISKIVIDTNDSNNIYTAVASGGAGGGGLAGPGVYKTTNGGQTWINILSPSNMFFNSGGNVPAGSSLPSVTDIAIDPFDSRTLLIGLGNISEPFGSFDNIKVPSSTLTGVWHTFNGGGTWDQIVGSHSGLPLAGLPTGATAAIGRVTIAYGGGKASDEHFVYVLMSTPPSGATAPFYSGGSMLGLFKTRSNNLSQSDWTKVMLKEEIPHPAPPVHDFQDIDPLGNNGVNVATLVVDPNNPNVVYLGGTNANTGLFFTPRHSLIYIDTGNMADTRFNFSPSILTNTGDDLDKEETALVTPANVLQYAGAEAYTGEGVFWYDIDENIAGTTSFNTDLIPTEVTSLAFDPRGRLLVGSDAGIQRGVNNGFGYDWSSGGAGILNGVVTVAITGAAYNAGNSTVTFTANNNFQPGDIVQVNGMTPGGYNGTYVVLSAFGNNFTVSLFFNPGAVTANGTATRQNVPYSTPGMALTSLNGNLQISDMTSVAIDPQNPNVYYTTQFFTGSAVTTTPLQWSSQGLYSPNNVQTGGVILAANPVPGSPPGTPVTLFRLWQYANAFALTAEVSVNNGATWSPLGGTGALPGATASAFPGFAVNPTPQFDAGTGIYQTQLLFGTQQVYFSRTSGTVWDLIPTGHLNNTIDTIGGVVTAMAFSPSIEGIIYVGTDKGEVYYDNINDSNPATAGFHILIGPGPNPVTSITVDPNNALQAFVTYGGANGGDHVFKVLATGVVTDISAGLPHVPAYSTVVDRNVNLGAANGKIYVGTNVGVFYSVNDGASWAKLGIGMPNVPVVSLSYSDTLKTLAAATLGRGVFTINTSAISTIGNQTIDEDTTSPVIPFTVNDNNLPAGTYTISATSSNQALIPNAKIVLGGSKANRTIQFTPALHANTPTNGAAIITITVKDNAHNTFTSSFIVTVNPVDSAPTITPIGNQSVPHDQQLQVGFSVNDVEDGGNNLVVTATSDNPALIPNDGLHLISGGLGSPNRTLTIVPATGNGAITAANGNGTAPVSITIPGVTPISITAASWTGGVATITAANTYSAGQVVTIAGMTPSAYNGTFIILSATGTDFTYALAANPGTATGFGTATVGTGLATGMSVQINGMAGSLGSSLNGNTYTILVTSPTTFLLNGTNAFAGIGSGGTWTIVNNFGTATITVSVTDSSSNTTTTTFEVNVTTNAVLPFTDDFNRTSQAFVGPTWSVDAGLLNDDGSQVSATLTVNAKTTAASTLVTVPSTTQLLVGMTVTGAGIPAGDTIATIVNSTTILLKTKTTTGSGSVPLTFSRPAPAGGQFLTTSTNLANINGLVQDNIALQADISVGAAAGQFAGLVARYGGVVSITASTWAANVATITANNTFKAGQVVNITGMTPSGYNGTFVITQATPTSFKYALATDPGGDGTAFGTAYVNIGDKNYYWGAIYNLGSNKYQAIIAKNVNGAWKQLASVPVTPAATAVFITQIGWGSGVAQAFAANNYSPGQLVTISGTGKYNGTFTILTADSTRFTYALPTNPGVPPAIGTASVLSLGTLFFDVTGSSLKLFYGPTGTTTPKLVAYAFDSSLTTGSAGVRMSGSLTGTTHLDNFAAAAIPAPASQTLPFGDDFTVPGTLGQLNPKWVEESGAFVDNSINTPAAIGQSSTVMNMATAVGLNVADVSVTATLYLGAVGQFAGLVTRYSGSTAANFYYAFVKQVDISNVQVFIYRNLGGKSVLIGGSAKIAESISGGLDFTFQAEGSSLKVFLNGEVVAFADDNSLTSGSVGMVTFGQVAQIFNINAVDVPSTPQSVGFGDDFGTGAPQNQLDTNAWLERAGNFNIISGAAVGRSTATLNIATVIGLNAADVSVQADVDLHVKNQSAGLVVRYMGPTTPLMTPLSNMYWGSVRQINATQVEAFIYRNINGVWSLIGSSVTPTNPTGLITGLSGTLVFVAEGTSLKLYYNGLLAAWATDNNFATGSVGIETTGFVGVDNFQTAAVASSNQALGAGDSFASNPPANQLDSTKWLERSGNFSVASGTAAVGQTTSVLSLATLIGLNATDEGAQADVTLSGINQSAGLVARYSGPTLATMTPNSNYYWGFVRQVNATQVQAFIFRNINGAAVQIGSSITPTNPTGRITGLTGTLQFVAEGSSLKLFFGGVLVAYAQDNRLASGSLGITALGGQAALANFQTAAVPSTNQSLGATDNFAASPPANQLDSTKWLERAGNFTVAGAAVGQTKTAFSIATLIGLDAADVSIAGDATLGAIGQQAGLVARYQGPTTAVMTTMSNMYAAFVRQVDATHVQAFILKNVNGVWTQIGSSITPQLPSGKILSVALNNPANLVFVAVGPSLKLYYQGTLAAYAQDSTFADGSAGIITYGGPASLANFQANAASVSNPGIPYTDNFPSNPPANQLGSAWTERVGNFSVAAGGAKGLASVTNFATVNGSSATDTTLQANIAFSAAGQMAGLVTRFSGNGDKDMYWGVVKSLTNSPTGAVQASILKNVNGVWTTVATKTISSFAGSLAFTASGNQLQLIVDGVQVFAGTGITDSTFAGPGLVGMRTVGGATVTSFSAS